MVFFRKLNHLDEQSKALSFSSISSEGIYCFQKFLECHNTSGCLAFIIGKPPSSKTDDFSGNSNIL